MSQNPIIAYDASYIGLYYALTAVGGYEMEEGLKTVTMVPVNQINQYDMTESIQIMFDVRTFNEKIGLIKDASNVNIVETAFDLSTNKFPIDTITVNAPEFVDGVTLESQIISVGKYQTLYSDFIMYVNNYFSYADGFSTLFTLSSQVDINNGIFDASAFIHIINGQTLNPTTGEYVKDLSGSITISYINQLLNYVVYANPFNNREPGMTAQDGFIAGDLIFIPNGLTATLNMDINNNNINWTSLGVTNVAHLNSTTNYVDGYFSVNTTTTETNIKRVIKAPLLLRLDNLS